MIEILIGCFGPKEPAKLSNANYEYNAALSLSCICWDKVLDFVLDIKISQFMLQMYSLMTDVKEMRHMG